MRINKYLSRCGLGARRKVEQLVEDGKITVNGVLVDALWVQVDPEKDRVEVSGEQVSLPEQSLFRYYKPRGVISTLCDEKGRTDLSDIAQKMPPGSRPAGRLDRESEGLLLWTNSGEWLHALMSPANGTAKIYMVTVAGEVKRSKLDQLKSVKKMPDGTRLRHPVIIKNVSKRGEKSVLEIELKEGKKRQIRELCNDLGWNVKRLVRTEEAGLTVAGLKPGDSQKVVGAELNQFIQEISRGATP